MLKGLKSMLFEEGEKKPEPAKSEGVSQAVLDAASWDETEAPRLISIPGGENQFYEGLAAKTDIFLTKAGAVIRGYLDSLSVIPDETLRLKTAIAQAKHRDGVGEDGLAGLFDGLKDKLAADAQTFTQALQTFVSKEITEREANIEKLKADLRRLQEELASESVKLAESQSIATTNEAQYRAASSRRAAELDQEKAKFLALTKG